MAQVFIEKGKSVRLTLRDSHLLSRGEEKRHHFKVEQDLTADPKALHGMPEWVLNAYNSLVKTGNLAEQQKFKVRLENVVIEMRATPKGRKLFSVVTNATLGSFVMNRTGDGDEDVKVTLSFSIYFAGRRDVHDWTYDQKRGDFFASFEEMQGELPLEGSNGKSSVDGKSAAANDDEEEEEDGDYEDEDSEEESEEEESDKEEEAVS